MRLLGLSCASLFYHTCPIRMVQSLVFAIALFPQTCLALRTDQKSDNQDGLTQAKPPLSALVGSESSLRREVAKHYDRVQIPTVLTDPDEHELPMVSILTYSRGEDYCYDNMILNALYQTYPHTRLELVVMETTVEPSRRWTDLANGSSLAQWARQAPENHPAGAPLKVVYQWFNASDKRTPNLGATRNMAADLAAGEVLINMDNDDIYHPNYVHYVVDHMRKGGLSFVVVYPHARLRFQPDGETVFEPGNGGSALIVGQGPPNGGHMTSFRREVAQQCRYAGVAIAEEHALSRCTMHNFGNRTATLSMSDGPLGHRFLLTKVQNPVSVTMQRFFVGRHLYNRMHFEDFEELWRHMAYAYLMIHEQTRPIGYPDATMTVTGADWKVPDTWRAFHTRHADFFNRRHYPFCEGFAGLPGQLFVSSEADSLQVDAKDASECCAKCSAMFNFAALGAAEAKAHRHLSGFPDDVHSGHCAGWTWNIHDQTCVLGASGLKYLPQAVSSFEAGVRVSACAKCGSGLDPADRVA